MSVVLEGQHLSKVYTGRRGLGTTSLAAVSDVSVALAPGEIVALVGESGSGKSTLGRLLLGTVPPTAGSVYLDGNLVSARRGAMRREYWRHVQFVFQDPFAALNPSRSVFDVVSRPLVNFRRLPRAQCRGNVEAILDQVGLSPGAAFADRRPHELSGGQRQRVLLARALAVEPRVIIADEPVSMLDVSIKAGILALMSDLRDRLGIAFLYITHDLVSAYQIADSTLVLYSGRVVESGATEDLTMHPRHPYTQMLIRSIPSPRKALPEALTNAALHAPARDGTLLAAAPAAGCAFAPRCPFAQAVCWSTRPPLRSDLSTRRAVACHLADVLPPG